METFVPSGLRATGDDATIAKEASLYAQGGAHLIISLAKKYREDLLIVAIAPLTPLAVALRVDNESSLEQVGGLFIQGQGRIEDGILLPDKAAFNLSEDMESAEFVFKTLQSKMPFSLLGKHAAYRVNLTRDDVVKWDETIYPGGVDIGTIAENVKGSLEVFRCGNPDLFYKLYPVPEVLRGVEGDGWFESLDVLSHPYDPLLCVLLYEPSLFDIVIYGAHRFVGMTGEHHGVPDSEAVHRYLVGVIATECACIGRFKAAWACGPRVRGKPA